MVYENVKTGYPEFDHRGTLIVNCIALQQLDLHNKSSEVCIKTRLPAASLPFKGQVTEQTTVKWSIIIIAMVIIIIIIIISSLLFIIVIIFAIIIIPFLSIIFTTTRLSDDKGI